MEQLANSELSVFLNQTVVVFEGGENLPSNSMLGDFFQIARAVRDSDDARLHSTSFVKPRPQMVAVSLSLPHRAQPVRARQQTKAPADARVLTRLIFVVTPEIVARVGPGTLTLAEIDHVDGVGSG
jgi:hypothetical protein